MRRWQGLVGALILIAVCFATDQAAAQATIIVSPGESIQQAVNDAPTGARIQVEPGTYAESITISKDGIVLEGIGTAGIVIEGRSLGTESGIQVVDAKNVTLANLTVRNFALYNVLVGDPHRPGSGGSGHVLRDLITTGARDQTKGQGIGVYQTTDAQIEGCSPSANPIGIAIGGTAGTPSPCHCVVRDNPVYDNPLAGIQVTNTMGVEIVGNKVGGSNVGVSVRQGGSAVTVRGNEVTGNSQGVLIAATDGAQVDHNVLRANNRASSVPTDHPDGYGLALWGASRAAVSFNTIADHTHAGIELAAQKRWGAGGTSSDNLLCPNMMTGNRIDITSDLTGTHNRMFCIVLPVASSDIHRGNGDMR
jgi:nitrous oxidase accessory protein NosD